MPNIFTETILDLSDAKRIVSRTNARFRLERIKTQEKYVSILLNELNKFLSSVSGRETGINDKISRKEPVSSERLNKLITDITNDFSKIFERQEQIETTISNLVNFSRTEREDVINLLGRVSFKLISTTLNDKLGTNFSISFSDTFVNNDKIDPSQSDNVEVDPIGGFLQLKSKRTILSSLTTVDFNSIKVKWRNREGALQSKFYPDGKQQIEDPSSGKKVIVDGETELGLFGAGQRWDMKQVSNQKDVNNIDDNHINTDLKSDRDKINKRIIEVDPPNIGEFTTDEEINVTSDDFATYEIIHTYFSQGDFDRLKKRVSEVFNIDGKLLNFTKKDSFESKFMDKSFYNANLEDDELVMQVDFTPEAKNVSKVYIDLTPTNCKREIPEIVVADTGIRISNKTFVEDRSGQVIPAIKIQTESNIQNWQQVYWTGAFDIKRLVTTFKYKGSSGWVDMSYNLAYYLSFRTEYRKLITSVPGTITESDTVSIPYTYFIHVVVDKVNNPEVTEDLIRNTLLKVYGDTKQLIN